MERERKRAELPLEEGVISSDSLEVMTDQFKRILEVPEEERDRVQRIQVIDRAAAAIAAARSLINDSPSSRKISAGRSSSDESVDSEKHSTGESYLSTDLW